MEASTNKHRHHIKVGYGAEEEEEVLRLHDISELSLSQEQNAFSNNSIIVSVVNKLVALQNVSTFLPRTGDSSCC